jgi:hypothetical protein
VKRIQQITSNTNTAGTNIILHWIYKYTEEYLQNLLFIVLLMICED